MTLLKICMLGVLCTYAACILRSWKSDLLPLLRAGTAVVLGICAIGAMKPLINFLTGDNALIGGEYLLTLGKALGVALLASYAAGICRECGESVAAEGIETAGKIEILLLSLPLIQSLLSTLQTLLRFGGQT